MELSRRALLQGVDYGLHGRVGQVLTLMRRNGDTSRNDRESKNDTEQPRHARANPISGGHGHKAS
jgi:hypothetical protein